MSGALDTMTAEESRQLDQMRQDDAASHEPEAPRAPPAADAAPEQGAEDRTIPQEALHKERERRKALEAELQKHREEAAATQARLTERFNLLMEAAKQPQAQAAPTPAAPEPEAPIPDINADPVGHFRAMSERLAKQVEALQGRIDQSEGLSRQVAEAQQVQLRQAQLRNWAMSQESQFAQQTPDYQDAMTFLTSARHRQLEALGIADPAARQQVIANDVAQIAQGALQSGANFGQQLYNLARATGYAPKAADPAAPAPDAGADRLATIERGREMATTLSAAGTAPAPRLTPERIAQMNDNEFAALLEQTKKRGGDIRDIMGH